MALAVLDIETAGFALFEGKFAEAEAAAEWAPRVFDDPDNGSLPQALTHNSEAKTTRREPIMKENIPEQPSCENNFLGYQHEGANGANGASGASALPKRHWCNTNVELGRRF